MSRPTLLIAGGGTGGHVFPGVAVAEAAQALADVDVVFVGTARGVESRVVPARGWKLEQLEVEPMKGGGARRALRGALVAARATLHAARIVRRLRPRAVLSVGGYASGPATLAAALLGVPVAVLEPNSTVGLANRLLAPFARRAFVAWDEAVPSFRASAIRQYGVPLRAGFAPRPSSRRDAAVRLLVMGGSQGAAFLNERLPDAVGRLVLAGRPIDVLHQAGRDREVAGSRGVRACEGRARARGALHRRRRPGDRRRRPRRRPRRRRRDRGDHRHRPRRRSLSLSPTLPTTTRPGTRRRSRAPAAAACVLQEKAAAEVLVAEIGRLLADDVARRAMADRARARGRPDAAARRREGSARARAPSPNARQASPRGSAATGGAADVPRPRAPRALRRDRRDRHERARRGPAHPRVRRQRLRSPAEREHAPPRGPRRAHLLRPRGRERERRRRRRVLERDQPAEPRDRAGPRARDPHHPARRDARGADADSLRRHHRRLARQDDHDVARRHGPARGGPRSDGRRRRARSTRSARTPATARATSSWPRPTRATAPS